jgi:hypothetical protein
MTGKPGVSASIISFCVSLRSYMLDVVAVFACKAVLLKPQPAPARRLGDGHRESHGGSRLGELP